MFDSSHANKAYYNHILSHFKMPAMIPEQFAFAHMHTVDETLAFLIRDPETLLAARQFRKQVSYLPFIRHTVAEQYLQSVLDRLRPAYKTAIATNRTDTMEHVLIEYNLSYLKKRDFFTGVDNHKFIFRPIPFCELFQQFQI
jgi:phosphoglycolate phosphatase